MQGPYCMLLKCSGDRMCLQAITELFWPAAGASTSPDGTTCRRPALTPISISMSQSASWCDGGIIFRRSKYSRPSPWATLMCPRTEKAMERGGPAGGVRHICPVTTKCLTLSHRNCPPFPWGAGRGELSVLAAVTASSGALSKSFMMLIPLALLL